MECTHVVLWVKDVSSAYAFYVKTLGCTERRYAPEEKFLSIGVGRFIINFYGERPDQPLTPGYAAGVAHLGFELENRASVDEWFGRLRQCQLCEIISTADQLAASDQSGPYRFYLHDPDRYVVEIHTWEGVEE